VTAKSCLRGLLDDVRKEALQHGIHLPVRELFDIGDVGVFLLGMFCVTASGLFWRNFIKTWKKPKVATGH